MVVNANAAELLIAEKEKWGLMWMENGAIKIHPMKCDKIPVLLSKHGRDNRITVLAKSLLGTAALGKHPVKWNDGDGVLEIDLSTTIPYADMGVRKATK
jgi:hypothetical protein